MKRHDNSLAACVCETKVVLLTPGKKHERQGCKKEQRDIAVELSFS